MISREDIENLATLARLQLAPGEIESLQKDISNILEYVGQVSSVSTRGLGDERNESDQTLAIPLHYNVMRDDLPRTTEDPLAGKEEALRAAFPKREGSFNVVRKIIQKDE